MTGVQQAVIVGGPGGWVVARRVQAQTLAVLASVGAVVGVVAVAAVAAAPTAGPPGTASDAPAEPSPDEAAASTSPHATAAGLSLDLQTTDGRSSYRVGETVGIAVLLEDGDGFALGGSIDMGVGETMPWPVAEAACVQPAPTYAAQPSSSRTTADTVYARPGTYTIEVTVETGNLCWPIPRESRTVQLRIDVVAG